jgi:hypothetical protein
MAVVKKEGIDGSPSNATLRNSLKDVSLMVDAHMVYLHSLGPTGDIGDGVTLRRKAEEQVAGAQLAVRRQLFECLCMHVSLKNEEVDNYPNERTHPLVRSENIFTFDHLYAVSTLQNYA